MRRERNLRIRGQAGAIKEERDHLSEKGVIMQRIIAGGSPHSGKIKVFGRAWGKGENLRSGR